MVERLSARGAGTPEAAAAAARPSGRRDDALAVAVAGGDVEVDAALLREHAAEPLRRRSARYARSSELHVEFLRQMHEAQEQTAMFEELRGAQELAEKWKPATARGIRAR